MISNVSGKATPEEFLKNVKDFTQNIAWGKVNNVIKGISTHLFTQVIEDTPVKYGWTQNSWFFSKDAPSDKTLPEYKVVAGKKVKKDYDKSGAINQRKTQNEIKRVKGMTKKGDPQTKYYFTNRAFPATLIEYIPNYSSQAPKGMVKINIDKIKNMNFEKYAVYKTGDEK